MTLIEYATKYRIPPAPEPKKLIRSRRAQIERSIVRRRWKP